MSRFLLRLFSNLIFSNKCFEGFFKLEISGKSSQDFWDIFCAFGQREIWGGSEGFVKFWEFFSFLEVGRSSQDGDGVGKLIEFLELVVSVLFKVLSVSFSEKVSDTFKFSFLSFILTSSVNLFILFGFEIILLFEFVDFSQLFVNVSYPFCDSSKERLILLVYDLRFFRVVGVLGLLRFFGHWIKNIKLKNN